MYTAFCYAVFGAFLGSALLCLMERHSFSKWTGRSMCPSCHQVLRWYELIPIASYLVQKGNCRRCKTRIPLTTLFAEISGAITFGMVAPYFLLPGTIKLILILLWVASIQDTLSGEVYPAVSYTALGLMLYRSSRLGTTSHLWAAALIFIVLYLLYCKKPGSIGGADVLWLTTVSGLLPVEYIAPLLILTGIIGLGMGGLDWLLTARDLKALGEPPPSSLVGIRLVPAIWASALILQLWTTVYA